MIFHRCASTLAQRYKGLSGWEVGRGGRWGGRWQKLPGEDTGHQSPSDGPDHSTRPKGHHSGRG